MDNASIIKKIKGLLAIANDNESDEESQSAFLLAQKLMVKHSISMRTVTDETAAKNEIIDGQATAYKKLFWWEIELALIVANNFKVKLYKDNKVIESGKQRKSTIVFFGYEKDVELAKELYILAYDALKFYAERYVKQHKSNRTNIKNSYMKGFLEGLKTKFKEQVKQMEQEYGLMVVVSNAVETAFKTKVTKTRTLHTPSVNQNNHAYQKGYTDGNRIDYSKSTIDNKVFG